MIPGARREMTSSSRTILVVDDHADTLESVRALLECEGHRVLTASSGAEALALLDRESIQLAVIDLRMPSMSGEELVGAIRQRDSLLQIVVQTAEAGDGPRALLRRLAIQGYHDKADGPERLLQTIDGALKAYDQLAQLHVAERLKTELLANVSHEFRTPLNIIIGYIDLLREGTFGACPSEFNAVFDKVLANGAYLLDLVEEFLDLSKLEAGAMRLRQELVQLTPFLRELGESFSLLVRTKPVEFRADIPDHLPAVMAESAKLRVIIQNLLSNAAKFTKVGHIGLEVRTVDERRVAIRVSDTGPGIAPEDHEAIFDMFHQLRPADAESRGSAGLGLALARRFARMMNGDITVESTLGAGTVFTVIVPTEPVSQTGQALA